MMPKSRHQAIALHRLRRLSFIAAACGLLCASIANIAARQLNTMAGAVFPSADAVPVLATLCGIGFALPLACLWASLFGPSADPRDLLRITAQRAAVAIGLSLFMPAFIFFGLPVPIVVFQAQVVLAASAGHLLGGAAWSASVFALPFAFCYPITTAILRGLHQNRWRALAFLGMLCGQYALLALLGIHEHPDAVSISRDILP